MKQLIPTLLLMTGMLTISQAAEKQTINVKLDAPDSTWSLSIDLVYQSSSNLYVISTLNQNKDMMGLDVITTLQDQVEITALPLPEKHFILGKTWNWENKVPYSFLHDRSELPAALIASKLVYKKTKQ